MKVRLTSDQLGPNPDFDFDQPPSASNPVNVTVPKGTQIEHPEALFFVINEQAEPADDEARKAWESHLARKEKAIAATNQTRPAIVTPPEPVKPAGGKKTGK